MSPYVAGRTQNQRAARWPPLQHLVQIIALAVVLLAPPAFAGDGDDDPTALLRKAKVAENVDHDAAKALALYKKVVEAGGTSDAARDAALKVADLLEAKGDKAGALEALRLVTERFATRLDDDAKRRVHESTLRLLPPGSRARTPLGEIYVEPAPGASLIVDDGASPLDTKIDALLSKLDGPIDVNMAQNEIRNTLTPVGQDALPALERAMMSGRPQRANFAAQLYAQIGQADAVPGFEKAIREGDGFTRAAAMSALRYLLASADGKKALAALMDRLLQVEALANRRETLRDLLGSSLPLDELMARQAAGGADASYWLQTALRRQAPGALERTLTRIRAGGADAGELGVALAPLISLPNSPSRTGKEIYPTDAMDSGTLTGLIEILLTQGVDGVKATSIARLARLMIDKAGAPDREAATLTAWGFLKRLPAGNDIRWGYASSLLEGRSIDVPSSAFRDPELAPLLLAVLPISKERLHAFAASDGPFWDAALAYFRTASQRDAMNLLSELAAGIQIVPAPRLDRGWLELLALDSWAPLRANTLFPLAKSAARSGDPAFLELVRRRTLGSGWQPIGSQLVSALVTTYQGPGRLGYVLEALKDAHVAEQVGQELLGALANDPDPRGRQALIGIAREPAKDLAPPAVQLMADARWTTDLVDLIQAEAKAPSPAPYDYRMSLLAAAENLHLREAIPFLLREFKEGLSAEAAKAMDSIRAYHERLSKFESWSKGEEAGRRDLTALLHDEDPEIRRAAVLSIAAMGDTEALPTLVKIAKEDKDPRVRAAVFDAVERISKEASKRAPPAPPKEPAGDEK